MPAKPRVDEEEIPGSEHVVIRHDKKAGVKRLVHIDNNPPGKIEGCVKNGKRGECFISGLMKHYLTFVKLFYNIPDSCTLFFSSLGMLVSIANLAIEMIAVTSGRTCRTLFLQLVTSRQSHPLSQGTIGPPSATFPFCFLPAWVLPPEISDTPHTYVTPPSDHNPLIHSLSQR